MSQFSIFILTKESEIPYELKDVLKRLDNNDKTEVFVINTKNAPPIDVYAQILETDEYIRDPDNTFALILKDDNVTTMSPQAFHALINKLTDVWKKETPQNRFDIAYLGAYMDRCDLYTNKVDVPDSTTTIYTTMSPFGTQAILFTPSGREKYLNMVENLDRKSSLSQIFNNAVSTGKLNALTMSPPVFVFDPKKAKETTDYVKTVQCREPQATKKTPVAYNSNLNLFWFILIVIIIIVIGWALLHVNNIKPQPSGPPEALVTAPL